MIRNALFCALFLLISLAPAYAQDRKLPVKEGTSVVIKFPPSFLEFQRVSANTLRTSYLARVTRGGDSKLAVNGNSSWRDAGWAFMVELALAKVDKQRDYVEVELRDAATNYKIQFDNSVGDLDAAFNEVVFTGTLGEFTASDYYRKEVADYLLGKTFTGKLASIPRDRQMDIVKDLGYVPGAVAGETFQNKFYISFAFVASYYDYDFYHESSARGARLKELIAATRRSFMLNGYLDIEGIKWVVKLRYGHEYETTGYKETGSEWMSAYIPFDLIRKYDAGSITEQALVNKSRILIGSTPVKVTVPATAGFPYFLGPKGGCYKINPSGNKTYVDASLCGK